MHGTMSKDGKRRMSGAGLYLCASVGFTKL